MPAKQSVILANLLIFTLTPLQLRLHLVLLILVVLLSRLLQSLILNQIARIIPFQYRTWYQNIIINFSIGLLCVSIIL